MNAITLAGGGQPGTDIPTYPWKRGDDLYAEALNAAIGNAGLSVTQADLRYLPTIAGYPPMPPIPGQLWWDSVAGQLYLYYNGAWVAATNIPGGLTQGDADARYLALSGGELSGMLSMTGARTWDAGAFPGTFPAIYQSLTYSGTPTTGLPGVEGTTYPVNAILLSESLNIPTGVAGGGAALEIQHHTNGGSAGRYSFLCTHQLNGSMSGFNYYYAANFMETAGANAVGAGPGPNNGKNQFGAISLYTHLGVGGVADVNVTEAQGLEWDFVPTTNSTADYINGVKLVSFAPVGWHAYASETFLAFAVFNPGAGMNTGIRFGDPQASDGKGFPISSTGTMIGSLAGSAGIGIDLSAVTFGTAVMQGPNGFMIEQSNRIRTNSILSLTNNWALEATSGVPLFTASGTNSGANYVTFVNAATGGLPQIQAIGTDPNVSLYLTGQGAAGGVMVNGRVGFQGTAPIAKPTVTGAKGGNAALASLLTALAAYGLVTDSTTA